MELNRLRELAGIRQVNEKYGDSSFKPIGSHDLTSWNETINRLLKDPNELENISNMQFTIYGNKKSGTGLNALLAGSTAGKWIGGSDKHDIPSRGPHDIDGSTTVTRHLFVVKNSEHFKEFLKIMGAHDFFRGLIGGKTTQVPTLEINRKNGRNIWLQLHEEQTSTKNSTKQLQELAGVEQVNEKYGDLNFKSNANASRTSWNNRINELLKNSNEVDTISQMTLVIHTVFPAPKTVGLTELKHGATSGKWEGGEKSYIHKGDQPIDQIKYTVVKKEHFKEFLEIMSGHDFFHNSRWDEQASLYIDRKVAVDAHWGRGSETHTEQITLKEQASTKNSAKQLQENTQATHSAKELLALAKSDKLNGVLKMSFESGTSKLFGPEVRSEPTELYPSNRPGFYYTASKNFVAFLETAIKNGVSAIEVQYDPAYAKTQQNTKMHENVELNRLRELAGIRQLNESKKLSTNDILVYKHPNPKNSVNDEIISLNGAQFDPDTGEIGVQNVTSLEPTHNALQTAGFKLIRTTSLHQHVSDADHKIKARAMQDREYRLAFS